MKLTLKIKLLPDASQSEFLLKTISQFNKACNYISEQAFQNKIFNHVKLHHRTYYSVREKFNLGSQLAVRAIGKSVNAYITDKRSQRKFRLGGSITYDSRLLTYRRDKVSICTLDGRAVMPFHCHRPDLLPYIKGEAGLIFKKGKFYLLQTIEFPETQVGCVDDFLGVDMGVVDIATLSTGERTSANWLNKYRIKRENIRSSIQRKGTKKSKKLLKRLSGRERSTSTLINHTISKRIVEVAKQQNKGIAIENLTHIRRNSEKKIRKKHRGLRSRWSFWQLRAFISYKAEMAGVRLAVIPPGYTSRTCSSCFNIGLRNGKSFSCQYCGLIEDADVNAAINISTWGRVVNRPEGSSMLSCTLH